MKKMLYNNELSHKYFKKTDNKISLCLNFLNVNENLQPFPIEPGTYSRLYHYINGPKWRTIKVKSDGKSNILNNGQWINYYYTDFIFRYDNKIYGPTRIESWKQKPLLLPPILIAPFSQYSFEFIYHVLLSSNTIVISNSLIEIIEGDIFTKEEVEQLNINPDEVIMIE